MTLTRTKDGSGEIVRCDGCGATENRTDVSRGWRTSHDGSRHSCPECAAGDDQFLPAFADVDNMTVDELEERFGEEHHNRILNWLESALHRSQIRPVHDHPDRYELNEQMQFPLRVDAGL